MNTNLWYIKLDCGGDFIMGKKTFLEAITITERLIDDIIFLCETRMKPTYFTRANCKMDFKRLIHFELNFVRKTLQLELDLFFKIIKGAKMRITKQGYSQARQKISPLAFVKMADEITRWYYGDNSFKTFKGYRLSAIDASILEIHNSQQLRDAFGYSEGSKTVQLARAKASGIYDIENDMIITSKISKYTTGEREIAVELIEKLKQLGLKNDLILLDRGYPSKDLFAYLEKSGVKYVCRISSKKIKQIHQAQEPDQMIKLLDKKGQTELCVRVLRFLLDSGEEEVLVTNLFDEELGIQDFKELYFKRWGIETKFDELKGRLQIENFTGDTTIAVEQDFYASIYLSNMAALAKNEANEKVTLQNKDKNLKYDYKINMNILIGKLKDTMVLMLLEDDPDKRKAMLRQVMEEISQNVVPIRPGRSNARKEGRSANKNPVNKKRCL